MKWILVPVIAIVIIGVAFLVSRIKDLEHWKNVTGIVGSLIAAIALLWAAFTFFENSRIQKTLAASSIYQEHMKQSILHPELSDGKLAPRRPVGSYETPETERKAMLDYEQYRWYIGHALYSFETILEVENNDPGWDSTINKFLDDHADYIGSDKFPCWRYEENLHVRIASKFKRDCSKQPVGWTGD